MTAIEYLLHLHSCEQEGIGSGMPTPQQWIDAVEAARKEYEEHSALKEQEVSENDLYEMIKYQNYGQCIMPSKDCDCEGKSCVAAMQLADRIKSQLVKK